MNRLKAILETDRKFRMDHNRLKKSDVYSPELTEMTSGFLDAYSDFENCDSTELLAHNMSFLLRYSEDLKEFKSTGKYPAELKPQEPLSRIAYDVPLTLSVFVSEARHSIMSNLLKLRDSLDGHVALIGIGAGLELALIAGAENNPGLSLEAYDLELSPFAAQHFKEVTFKEYAFDVTPGHYDYILAIELLEHLSDPFSFIKNCADSLKKSGRFIFTTATDMPQFDHLFNFTDDALFAEQLNREGLKIIEKQDLFHHYMGGPKSAKNTWYVCEKVSV